MASEAAGNQLKLKPVNLLINTCLRCAPVRAFLLIATALVLSLGLVACSGAGPTPAPATTFPDLPPAWPFVFNGNVTVDGQQVPDGYKVTGRIGTYRSASVTTSGGRYLALPVGPLDAKFFDRDIVFELASPDGRTVDAKQRMVFRALPQPSVYELNLTFPKFR